MGMNDSDNGEGTPPLAVSWTARKHKAGRKKPDTKEHRVRGSLCVTSEALMQHARLEGWLPLGVPMGRKASGCRQGSIS